METHTKSANAFLNEICSIPGGEKIRLCIQCGTCSGSCPNADKMEYTPRQLIAMARAGMQDEVLSSNSMWYCASCYLCTVCCPRDIKPTDLMHVLECLAGRHGLSSKKTKTPIMYQTFSNLVYGTGGMPEVGFMMRFYLKTNPFSAVKMLPTALSMLRHGRLSLKSRKLKPEAQRQLKAILNKAKELGGS